MTFGSAGRPHWRHSLRQTVSASLSLATLIVSSYLGFRLQSGIDALISSWPVSVQNYCFHMGPVSDEKYLMLVIIRETTWDNVYLYPRDIQLEGCILLTWHQFSHSSAKVEDESPLRIPKSESTCPMSRCSPLITVLNVSHWGQTLNYIKILCRLQKSEEDCWKW